MQAERKLTALHQRYIDQLRYYTPDAPILAIDLGRVMKLNGNHESIRRSVRRIVKRINEIKPDTIGSFLDGYFLIRTSLDREMSRNFKRNHGLGELHTSRKQHYDANQEAAL